MVAIMDGIAIKGIIIPASLQHKDLRQLHISHMGIEKTRMLALELLYLINMKANIKGMVKKDPLAYSTRQGSQKIQLYCTKYEANHGNV